MKLGWIFDARTLLLLVCGGICGNPAVQRRYKWLTVVLGGIGSALLIQAALVR